MNLRGPFKKLVEIVVNARMLLLADQNEHSIVLEIDKEGEARRKHAQIDSDACAATHTSIHSFNVQTTP